jgi:beta-phosphoglucomutase
MKTRACLFDLDGVLVDTAGFHYIAWKKLADNLGFPFTPHDNERLKGVSRMDSLDILLEIGNVTLNNDEKYRYADQKNKVYLSLISEMTPEDILPGAVRLLSSLKNLGILIALGSSSKNARLILERTGILHFFDAIVDGNLITRAKPDPEVFSLGARMLHVENRCCVVFEDAIAGIDAAHNAGMKCIGIGSSEILGKADRVFPNLAAVGISDLDFDEYPADIKKSI